MRRIWHSLALIALGISAVLYPVVSARAEGYGLLIGVSEVAALPRRLWLHGPGNDVVLMRQALLSRGFAAERITVLAGSAVGSIASARPTRQAIDRAMADLLARVRPGDHVVLHLAGHGTQVPQRPDAAIPEPDGLDEVFLTADTGLWDAVQQRLPNALLDDEIGAWIDALVDRGATAWAVFDTCHALGMSRGNGSGARSRSVGAAELGVPSTIAKVPVATRHARTMVAKPVAIARQDGRVLAFAARGQEATVEEWLPRGAGLLRARMHGIFTHAVALAMQEGVSDVQGLRMALQRRYAQEGRLAPVPLVVGPATAGVP